MLRERNRITLEDTYQSATIKMVDGNPGALLVCMYLLQEGEKIDPDSALGGLGVLLHLDDMGIYGPRIWMLYKDVCGEDMINMLGVLRARQLGYLSESKLHHAIDHYGEGIDVVGLIEKVKERLPNFGNINEKGE